MTTSKRKTKFTKSKSKAKSQAKQAVVGYIRVSTTEQAGEGVSLASQETNIRQWAEQRGHEVLGVYKDVQSGARADNREGLQKAIDETCKAGGILVVYAAARLARSMKDFIAVAERVNDCGANIASCTEPLDTSTAMGEAFFLFVGLMANLERRIIVERTTVALAYKRANNERISGHLPYGYKLAVDGVHLEPEPTEQAVIKRVLKLRAKGLSYRAICEKLCEAGIPNRAGKAEGWRANSIMDILRRAESASK